MLGAATQFLAQTVRMRLPRFARRARRTRSVVCAPVRHNPTAAKTKGA